jgi:hypothetical protein
MNDSDYAAGQLRIIRSLMERATVYRAVSAPTAFVGGLLSLGGFAMAFYHEHFLHRPLSPTTFRAFWLVILALTGLTNIIFLWRNSSRRNEPFFSSGMKLASSSLAPAFLTAGLLTLILEKPLHLAVIWVLFYGMGLLSTQHFAPRSLVVLGITFFLSGCALLVMCRELLFTSTEAETSALVASGIMATTFGGFHLIYATAVWVLGDDRSATAPGSGTAHV